MEIFIVPLIFGLIVAVVVAAAAGSRRYEAQWKAAADRLGLEFQPGRLFTRSKITGSVDGMGVTVDISSSSSGSTSSVRTRYRVRYRALGFELRMSRQTGFGKAAELLGMGDVKIGDDAFDDAFSVRTSDPQSLTVRLTPATRRILLNLVNDYRSVKITDDHIGYEKNGIDRDTATVVTTTRRLIEAARALYGGLAEDERPDPPRLIRDPIPPSPPVLQPDPFKPEPMQIDLPGEAVPVPPGPETLPPAEPAVAGATAEQIAADLFSKKGLSFQLARRFESQYQGKAISWTGEVREVITGIGPNDPTRVTVRVAAVRHELFGNIEVEVVAFVAGRIPRALTVGRPVTVHGTLSGIDAMSRRLFAEDARLSDIQDGDQVS